MLKNNVEEIFMMLKPLFDKVVLKRVAAEEKTKTGILLPDSAKEKPEVFEVVAVGTGKLSDGKKIEMTLSVGDKVIAAKYSGTEVKLDGVEYTVIAESDVLAIVE